MFLFLRAPAYLKEAGEKCTTASSSPIQFPTHTHSYMGHLLPGPCHSSPLASAGDSGQRLWEGSGRLMKPQIHAGTTPPPHWACHDSLSSLSLPRGKLQEAKAMGKWSLNNSRKLQTISQVQGPSLMPVPVRCLKFCRCQPLHCSFSRMDGTGETLSILWCACADHVIAIRLLAESRVCAQGGEQTRKRDCPTTPMACYWCLTLHWHVEEGANRARRACTR